MSRILQVIFAVINPIIDDSLEVANRIPELTPGEAGAVIAFWFILFLVVMYTMALRAKTGGW